MGSAGACYLALRGKMKRSAMSGGNISPRVVRIEGLVEST